MTSSTDSMAQRLETDSCPARPRSAGTAGFSMSLPRVYDYHSKQRPQADSLFQSVPPPPPLMSTETYLWKYPEYRFYDLRFASFESWPKFLRGPYRKDLARAGFVYTQTGDKVTCFCCGITLSQWEPFDDAYREHIRWARNCQYARMVCDVQCSD